MDIFRLNYRGLTPKKGSKIDNCLAKMAKTTKMARNGPKIDIFC